jgi:hypothetical protein
MVAFGDGSGFHGIGREGVSGHVGGKGVGSGSYELVGLEVQPFSGVRAKKVNYQKKWGIFDKQARWEIVHRAPSQQTNIQASVDVQRDAGLGIGAVSPMDGSVGIAQGEGEWGFPLEVGSVDGHFARIRYGCGGQGLSAGRENDSETKGYQKLVHRLAFRSFDAWVKGSFGAPLRYD